ncbi:MAG TPA: TonB family protein [Rhizomicrobium sp.]
MEQPAHDLRPYGTASRATPQRTVAIVLVALVHLGAIYALATGLAQNLYKKTVQEFKAEVIPPKQEVVKPPPPPPPQLQKPPPPFVPPPDIVIQSEAAPTNTITVQSKVSTPPPPPAPPQKVAPPSISSPVLEAGGAGKCQSSYYPPIAIRLNQTGTTTVSVHVGADGSVQNVTLVNSSGHDSLDQAAIKCITGAWHYKPAMQSGQPVAQSKDYAIVWRIQ